MTSEEELKVRARAENATLAQLLSQVGTVAVQQAGEIAVLTEKLKELGAAKAPAE